MSDDKWITARHEAGHAVAALHYNCPLAHVTIEQDGYKLGTTRIGVQKPEDAIVLFCGPLAEKDWQEFVPGRSVEISTYGVDEGALRYLAEHFGDLNSYYTEALSFMSDSLIQQQIDRVAAALLKRPTLTVDEVRAEAGFIGPLRYG
jgi:hypothetical protein